MHKGDSICVSNVVFPCFVIYYSYFKRCLKNPRMLCDGPFNSFSVVPIDSLWPDEFVRNSFQEG